MCFGGGNVILATTNEVFSLQPLAVSKKTPSRDAFRSGMKKILTQTN
jgi:hypothetical protein